MAGDRHPEVTEVARRVDLVPVGARLWVGHESDAGLIGADTREGTRHRHIGVLRECVRRLGCGAGEEDGRLTKIAEITECLGRCPDPGPGWFDDSVLHLIEPDGAGGG